MDSLLLAVLAVYGLVGGILAVLALRWNITNYYAFPHLERVRYALTAMLVGGYGGAALAAGVAVALHVSAPAVFASAVGAGVAGLIALVQGAPKQTGLALPPAYREAMHDIARIGAWECLRRKRESEELRGRS